MCRSGIYLMLRPGTMGKEGLPETGDIAKERDRDTEMPAINASTHTRTHDGPASKKHLFLFDDDLGPLLAANKALAYVCRRPGKKIRGDTATPTMISPIPRYIPPDPDLPLLLLQRRWYRYSGSEAQRQGSSP